MYQNFPVAFHTPQHMGAYPNFRCLDISIARE